MAKEYAQAFYKSDAWQRTRSAYFKYKCGICERCGGAGKIVHHKIYITPKNIGDPRVTLNFKNLELLCQECHNAEHAKKQSSRYQNSRYTIDENGNVLPPIPKKTL